MRLGDLFEIAGPDAGREIAGLSADSRAVAPGFLFAALPGTAADGLDFIDDAVRRGAVAVLCAEGTQARAARDGLAVVAAAEPRRALALAAARFFGPQPAHIAAVTGTNGKTSVASFVRQIFEAAGVPAASFGTTGVAHAGRVRELRHTTPDPVEIHAILAGLKREGVEHVAFEASSHGLAQHRVDGVRIEAAGFTNLTRDHLDYHPTFDAYRDAKLRLMTDVLPSDGTAVIDVDGPHGATFAGAARAQGARVWTVGRSGAAIRLLDAAREGPGQRLRFEHEGTTRSVLLPLIGGFQASNALVAAGLAIATGADPDQAFAALEMLKGAAGRLEEIGRTPSGGRVLVDYAHTPDALETVLRAVRPHTEGRLVTVFGAGGDRDPGKRRPMGEAAARHADIAILTDDNPRSEDPAAIRAAVREGAPEAREIADRAEAIRAAVALLRAGDVLVIAGKGHETGQTAKGVTRPFDDRVEARAAIAALETAS